MANNLEGLITPILVKGLQALRTRCIAPRLVNTSYSDAATKRGTVIQIPAYSTATTFAINPSSTLYDAPDITVGMVNLPINQWQGAALNLTDQDYYAINNGGEAPAIQACVDAISADIHASIINTYKGIYGFVGTPGTTPFTGGTPQDAVDVGRVLTTQKAPMTGRQVLLEPTAAGSAKMVAAFYNNQFSPESRVLTTGQLANTHGMIWHEVHTVPIHTAGLGAGYLVNNAAGIAVGATTVAVDTGTGTLVAGDVITFANHTQTYVITANHGGGAGNITVSPAVRVAVPDNNAITLKASHTVNMAFTKDAIAFASRPEVPTRVSGVVHETLVDDDPTNGTGLALNIEFQRQNKQDLIILSCMWGCVLARPEFAVRLAG